jgi:hypothetical protein
MRLPRRQLAGIILLLAALLLAMALTACAGASGASGIATADGGTSQPSPSTSSDTASLTDAQKARKFAQCMQEHGIDVTVSQDGKGGSGIMIKGASKAKVDAATKACQKYAPGSGGSNRRPDPKALAQARRFAQCMRDHGVTDFPDPDPTGGIRVEGKKGSDLAPDNPTLQKAQKACESLIGRGGPLSTGGRGTGDNAGGGS